jgi:ATP-dependent DNA ligase
VRQTLTLCPPVSEQLLISHPRHGSDHTVAKQVELFTSIFNRMSARSHKWLARIIVKEMRVGVGERSILKALHPDALRWKVK